MSKEKDDHADRELSFTRLLNAPIKVVWEAWSNPEQLSLWWGPDNFSNTILKMKMIPNGEWDMIMHAPDGTDFEIKSIFLEIVRYKKIVYQQLTHFKYVATIEFEKRDQKTFVSWKMIFENKEKLLEAAKIYGVIDGFNQHTRKFDHYLQHKVNTHETN